MMRTGMMCVLAGAMLTAVSPPSASGADVHIGVNIGAPPPPPIVLEAPPPLVAVPGSPVYYAPELPYNVFYYDGHYYTLHDEAWFSAASFSGPWGFVAVAHVPRPILAVPVSYYRVPRRHWRKHRGRPRWDRDDDSSDYSSDDDHRRGRGRHDD